MIKGHRTDNEVRSKDGNKALIRLFIGGIIGFLVFYGLCCLWMVYKNNVNPVSSLGALSIGFIGLVMGAMLSLLSKNWNRK